jgi:tetratricopeptide (TPR) repeat protein
VAGLLLALARPSPAPAQPAQLLAADPAQVQDLYGHAVEVAEETRRKVPAGSGPLFDLARVHQRFGFDDRALEAFRQCQKADPGHPEVLEQIGFLLSQRFPDEALAAYREALRLDPKRAHARTRIGLILIHQGQLEKAVEELRAEVSNRSAGALTYLLLGQAQRDLRRYPEALGSFREALRLDPEERRAYYGLAQVHQSLGQKEEEGRARAEFLKRKEKEDRETQEAAKKGANRETLLRNVSLTYLDAARTYQESGLEAEAERSALASLRFHPQELNALKLLLDLLRRKGRVEEALARCREYVARARSPEPLYLLAGLCTEKQSFAEAAALLEEVIRLQPADTDARRELARLILGEKVRGELSAALELARAAVERAPTAVNYEVLGWALYKSGDLKGALEAASATVRLDPKNPLYRQRLADLERRVR